MHRLHLQGDRLRDRRRVPTGTGLLRLARPAALARAPGLVDRGARDLGPRLGRRRPRPPPPLPRRPRGRAEARSRACPRSRPASCSDYRDAKVAAEKIAGRARDRVLLAVRRVRRRPAHERPRARQRSTSGLAALAVRARLQRRRAGDVHARATRAGDPLRISRLRVDPTLTPQALFDRIELAIAASGTIEQPACVGSSLLVAALAAIVGGTAVALASHSTKAQIALPAARTGQAAGDRVHAGASLVRGPGLALGAPRLAHGDLARVALARARTARSPTATRDAFARGPRRTRRRPAARAARPRAPDPLGARLLSSTRKRTALRLAVMLRSLGAQGLVLDLGPVPAADRAALARVRCATCAPRCRAARASCVVVPPITDRASQRRAAGYDLRDLSRPATLVLRACGGRSRVRRPSSDRLARLVQADAALHAGARPALAR